MPGADIVNYPDTGELFMIAYNEALRSINSLRHREETSVDVAIHKT
jgi:hypothetical protein